MRAPSELSDANFMACHFYLLNAATPCPHCGMVTAVFALAVPAPHQWLHTDDEDERADIWQAAQHSPAVLLHVEALNGSAAIQLRDLAPGYRPGRTPASGVSRWVNHCDLCDRPLEDDDLHCEPEAAFMPVSPEAARMIRLTEVHHPLEVKAADSAPDPIWLAHVTRG
jgi:hypothetical protein